MTDTGSIVPDTAKNPIAPDLVHPQQAQNGSVSGHLPTDSHVGQLGTADQKVNAQFGNGQAQEPAKAKPGIVNTILTAPIKGPRNGIHWGADRLRLAAEKGKSNFSHPLGIKPKHRKIVRTFGQVGWVFKGLVYAIIGGVACQASAQGISKVNGADLSPQGAFILVGNNSFGYPLLVVMAVGVFTYAAWRFWEGITGQGSDDAFGPFKNFFRYRLSPLVSGCVYTAYGIFVVTLIPRFKNIEAADNQGGFPNSWAHSGIGKFGIAICGLAFLIATITQLQAAFTRNFHFDMKDDLPNWLMWLVIVTGHIGFIGRAGVFVFVSVLFFRVISDSSVNSSDATTIGNGLAQLQKNHGGRACLFILGFFLIIYGLFAVLNAYCKVYPTPPPSRRPIRVKQARLAAEKAAQDAGQQEGDAGHGTDKSGRQKLGAAAGLAYLAANEAGWSSWVLTLTIFGCISCFSREPAWNHRTAYSSHGADVPADIQHNEGDSPKTADYKQRQRERYLANRDIEAGLGEEWEAKGRLGSDRRPHFWRSSHGQAVGQQHEIPRGHHDPVMPMAPVAEGTPVSMNQTAGNSAANTALPTGWV